jgi:DIM1 family U5 snRNP protein
MCQLSEEARLVVLRFGSDANPACMTMDEHLYKIADAVKNFAVIYTVDNKVVPDFNAMYELYDVCTVMFFWRYVYPCLFHIYTRFNIKGKEY